MSIPSCCPRLLSNVKNVPVTLVYCFTVFDIRQKRRRKHVQQLRLSNVSITMNIVIKTIDIHPEYPTIVAFWRTLQVFCENEKNSYSGSQKKIWVRLKFDQTDLLKISIIYIFSIHCDLQFYFYVYSIIMEYISWVIIVWFWVPNSIYYLVIVIGCWVYPMEIILAYLTKIIRYTTQYFNTLNY